MTRRPLPSADQTTNLAGYRSETGEAPSLRRGARRPANPGRGWRVNATGRRLIYVGDTEVPVTRPYHAISRSSRRSEERSPQRAVHLSSRSTPDYSKRTKGTASRLDYVTAAVQRFTATRLDVGTILALVAVIVAGCGISTAYQARLPNPRHAATASAVRGSRSVLGTGSTPGILPIPQMGFVSFRCDRAFRVEPYFDTHGSTNGDDLVTVRAGDVMRRNFATHVVPLDGKTLDEIAISPKPIVALPYAHYGLVTFAIHEDSEARILDANVSAHFVARSRNSGRAALGACYVRRWLLALRVR
jgi:hypothetical protein